VKEQIRVAEGHPLSFQQDDLKIHGHAVEIRVYAEDPCNNFLPDIGKLQRYVRPQGAGVRVDDGFEEGMDIPIYYDPMIAKLITWGESRTEAIDRMIRAIDEYVIVGCETTLSFCDFVMKHEAFRSGNFDTHFVSRYFKPEMLRPDLSADERSAAALMAALLQEKGRPSPTASEQGSSGFSAWKMNRS
jgi:acetyl/propionyl-CoA carboxylase alpha subunit